jgi:hypothetical protein
MEVEFTFIYQMKVMVKYYFKKYYFMNVSQSQVYMEMEEQFILIVMDIVNFYLYVEMNVKQQLIILVNSVCYIHIHHLHHLKIYHSFQHL